MIKKQVKATKRKNSNSYTYKINLKVGEFEHDEKVAILNLNDYETLIKEIDQVKNNKSAHETVEKQILELEEKDKEISDLTLQIQNKINEIAKLDENIKILKESSKETSTITKENNNLMRENTELFQEIKKIKDKYHTKNKELKKQLQDQEYEIKNLRNNNETIKQMETNYKETIEQLNKNQHETLTKITKQHSDQLKESYDKFNEDLKKYISVNQLQNAALKQILELGFIELLRNKHKKIAKDQIKELKEDKKVYELTPKKE